MCIGIFHDDTSLDSYALKEFKITCIRAREKTLKYALNMQKYAVV